MRGISSPAPRRRVLFRSQEHRVKRARRRTGADLQTVLTNLKGHVELINGIAKFSHLSFTMPGGSAQLDGSYNVITEKIDLHGMLRTDAELANTVQIGRAS